MTPTRETLLALADRVEALTGPDREVDFLIWAATSGVAEISWPTEGHPMTPGKGGRVEGYGPDGEWNLYGFIDPQSSERNWQPYGGEDRYPRFTRSLDAAMTLVPEGRGWLAGYGRIRPDEPLGGAMITRIAAPTSFAPDAADKIAEAEAATPALALTAAALRARATLTDHPVTSEEAEDV